MALLTAIRDLHRRKGRERRGLALAEGLRLVEEMVAAGVPCKGVAIAPALDATARGTALKRVLAARGIPIETVSDQDLVELAATEHPQGIIAVYQERTWSPDECAATPGHPLIILDAVQDPGNTGTIARTALAFGASGVIALPGTADLTNPKTVRGAMGALFRLPHCHADDATTLAMLARRNIALWAMTMDGDIVGHADQPITVALLVGNEGAGIRAELLTHASRRIVIPIAAAAESLNVAVAAAIGLYQVTR